MSLGDKTLKKYQDLLNRRFGEERYTLVRSLGKGSFYHVFEAFDNSFKKPCVLKKAMDSTHAEREIIEYRELVVHKHIAKVDDIIRVRTIEGGTETFVLMELADGSLEQLIEDHHEYFEDTRNIYRVLEHAVKGLEPLHHHKERKFHRDLHPGNLLYFEGVDGDEDIFKITDFGLVSRKGKRRTSKTRGVVSYRAPELESKKIGDPRSDIYSIGAILYTIVVGNPMFEDDSEETRKAKSTWKFVKQKIMDNVSDKSFRKILLKCLHPDPDERYQSGKELLNALGTPIDTRVSLENWINPLTEYLKHKTQYGTHSTLDVTKILETRVSLENYIRKNNLGSDESVREQLEGIDDAIIEKRIQDYEIIFGFAQYGVPKSEIKWNEAQRKLFHELSKEKYWDFSKRRKQEWKKESWWKGKVPRPNETEILYQDGKRFIARKLRMRR